MEHIIEYIARHTSDILGIFAALGIVFEVTPIRFNPISEILRWIGKRTNRELNEKIDIVCKDLGYVKADLEHSKKKQNRILISNFANDLRHGEEKTESQYIAIMDLVNEYLTHGWNSKVQMEAIFIKNQYELIFQRIKKKGD